MSRPAIKPQCSSSARSGLLRHKASAAFTLIELLAVIAIMALLVSIVVAVLGRVRASARSTQCASNLRQVGVAMHLYAIEHAGKFPSARDTGQTLPWMFALIPYVGIPDDAMGFSPRARSVGAFVCPEFAQADIDARLVSYAYNKYITRGQWNYVHAIVPQPANIFLVTEVSKNIETSGAEGLIARHPSAGANFLYVDGHVENLLSAEAINDTDDRWRWW